VSEKILSNDRSADESSSDAQHADGGQSTDGSLLGAFDDGARAPATEFRSPFDTVRSDDDGASFSVEETPRVSRSDLAKLYTPGGIGRVVTNALDAFYKLCGAPPLDDEDTETTRKIVAEYFKARMPKEASAYQPELMLAIQLAVLTLPRVQPIAAKTAPFWRRMWDKIRRKKT
jgi:hypothetical protein